MRIVDKFGNTVENLEDLQPWCHYVEHVGEKNPIQRITYSSAIPKGKLESLPEGRSASIKIEWDTDANRE